MTTNPPIPRRAGAGEPTLVAAVQASYVLLDREACVDKAAALIAQAAQRGARIVVLPEAFIPGAPVWIDSRPIWDGDADWYALLVEQAVVVPGPVTVRLGAAARAAGAYVVIGVQERDPHGSTLYNTTLYFGPDGRLLAKHRKLMPTGSERSVWGQGDGSTLPVLDTPFGRLSGLTCWENYMPLARFYLYAQGVDLWAAPTLARGDGWLATMRHIAREGRCYVVGVNPCVRADQLPADLPHRDRLWPGVLDPTDCEWVEPGNSVIVAPDGSILAGPARHEETILLAEMDLRQVHAARRMFDASGHYHRPDIFRLAVDIAPRPPFTRTETAPAEPVPLAVLPH
ncbi:MAG: carbon-nitrogen hydrolase family protein [Piscinibacter sp.]|nr:carbon-nitrogen hydrolase family protein [Piscinibacter sp.]